MAELGEANIGGRMVPAWLLNLTAEELDSLKSRWYSNPNLLDNWYFENPVNQRGQTECTETGYTVDRWLQGFDGTLTSTLTDDGIKIAAGNDGTYKNFEQVLPYVPTNTTFTMSFLVDNFASISQIYTWFSASQFDIRDNLITCTFKAGSSISGRKSIGIQVKPGKTATIKAAKLELGSQQTLAHQDADGNWVLNEIPDYGEQLARCQRYQNIMEPGVKMIGRTAISNDASVVAFFPLPTTMRAKPIVSGGASIAANYRIYANGVSKTPTAVSVNSICENGILLALTIPTGLGVMQTVVVEYTGTDVGILNSNL